MNKKLLIIAVIFIIGALGFMRFGVHVSVNKNHQTMAQRLELTKEQVAVEAALKQETKKELAPVIKDLDSAHSRYNRLVKQKADSRRIISQKQKIEKLTLKYNDIHKDYMRKFQAILTTEQQSKFTIIRKQLFLDD